MTTRAFQKIYTKIDNITKAAYLFNALPTKAVRTIDALREKQEKAA